jgi:aromatic-L-amino-acid/L-tryptophan decarboxylase
MLMYASVETHGSIQKAADLLGLGQKQVRLVAVDDSMQLRIDDLERAIREDRMNGDLPFCVVANGGTVNTGAVDPIPEIAAVCRKEGLWLHVDGAYGVLAALAPTGRKLFQALSQADSISLDPHKWLYVPMDAGCVLFRDPLQAKHAFGYTANYMRVNQDPETREGYAFFDYGPELSRRFRALRIWVSLKYFGSNAFAYQIERNIQVAAYLQDQVKQSADFQLLAPGPLSIACFRYIPDHLRRRGPSTGWTFSDAEETLLNALNSGLLWRLQQDGGFYPSGTMIRGREAIRVCIVNYLAEESDMDALLEAVRLHAQT